MLTRKVGDIDLCFAASFRTIPRLFTKSSDEVFIVVFLLLRNEPSALEMLPFLFLGSALLREEHPFVLFIHQAFLLLLGPCHSWSNLDFSRLDNFLCILLLLFPSLWLKLLQCEGLIFVDMCTW